jgi:putative methionine-R-sulfoxide reductase with GAF domain
MGGDDHKPVPVGCPVFSSREACYEGCLEQVKALVTADAEFTSALSNAASVLFYNLNAFANSGAPLHALDVNWCGFYLLHSAQDLLLGPFQGKVACQKIRIGKGVCGTSVLHRKNQAVPDVHAFPGHIACDGGSESEAVVLIRDTAGRIVGLLDIDSTKKNFFSDSDIAPLEAICNHLGATLTGKFPISSARPSAVGAEAVEATRLPTAIPAFSVQTTQRSPQAGAGAGAATSAKSPTTTTFVHHPPAKSTPTKAPTTNNVVIGPWEFQSVQHDMMMKSAAFGDWEEHLHVKMLPEIIFNENRLNFVCALQPAHRATDANGLVPVSTRPGYFRFTANAADALKSATEFYKTDAYRSVASEIAVPASASWDKYRESMQSFDPNIDWAFRNRYVGTVDFTPGAGTEPQRLAMTRLDDPKAAPARQRVNYDMLKRTDLPIKFFAAFDLFDDDLHDGGMSKLSVKSRAMDTCFFALLRHVVRVDGVILLVRDVRVYHEYALSPPTVVIEEVERRLTLDDFAAANPATDRETLRRQMAREDECLPTMQTTFEGLSYVELPEHGMPQH